MPNGAYIRVVLQLELLWYYTLHAGEGNQYYSKLAVNLCVKINRHSFD